MSGPNGIHGIDLKNVKSKPIAIDLKKIKKEETANAANVDNNEHVNGDDTFTNTKFDNSNTNYNSRSICRTNNKDDKSLTPTKSLIYSQYASSGFFKQLSSGSFISLKSASIKRKNTTMCNNKLDLISDNFQRIQEAPTERTAIHNLHISSRNEISFNERRKIRSFTKKAGQEKSSLEYNSFKTGNSNINSITDSENLKRLKNLMRTCPYKNLPGHVKYFNEKEQDFKQHVPKLSNSSLTKDGHKFKCIQSGASSIYFKTKFPKENLLKKLLTLREEHIPSNFRKSIKWKSLKFLLSNKRDYVDLLISCYKKLQWFVHSRKGKMNRQLFEELVSIIYTKQDTDFVDNIFLIFDEDRDGLIDFKETIFALSFFKNDYYQHKMNTLAEIFSSTDEYGFDVVDINEFLRVAKPSIIYKKDLKRLSEIFRNAGNMGMIIKDGIANKISFYDFLIENEEVKVIFTKNMEAGADSEANFDEELNHFCMANLKKSKMVMNMDIGVTKLNDHENFESVLKIRQMCIETRRNNYKLKLIEHDSISDDEK